MPRPKKIQVSPAELDVLRALWDGGQLTLGEIHSRIADRHAYTTAQTLLDRLVEKGLVRRDRRQRPARHEVKVSRSGVIRHFSDLLLDKVCEGPGQLVLQLLRDERFTPDELAEIRKLIDSPKTNEGASDE